MKITRASAVIALSIALLLSSGTLATQSSAFYTEAEGIPAMINPVTTNAKGVVELQNDDLLDFLIPERIGGVPVDAIGAFAFEGCDLIRTVTIPATVTEIGAGAFANCPYLQAIILKDRANLKDMYLGANWSGDAQIVFSLMESQPSEPSAGKLAFDQAVSEAMSILYVDAANMPYAKMALNTLQITFSALSEAEKSDEIFTVYQTAVQKLSQLIETAEMTPSIPVVPEVQLDPPADTQVDSEQSRLPDDGDVPQHIPAAGEDVGKTKSSLVTGDPSGDGTAIEPHPNPAETIPTLDPPDIVPEGADDTVQSVPSLEDSTEEEAVPVITPDTNINDVLQTPSGEEEYIPLETDAEHIETENRYTST